MARQSDSKTFLSPSLSILSVTVYALLFLGGSACQTSSGDGTPDAGHLEPDATPTDATPTDATPTDAMTAVTCDDSVQNGDETGIDCGGAMCAPCPPANVCRTPAGCDSGLCMHGSCLPFPWRASPWHDEWRDDYGQPYPAHWQTFLQVTDRYLQITHYDTDNYALDLDQADMPTSYQITSPTDPAYREPTTPMRVGRRSIMYKLRPSWFGRSAHTIYLELPSPMISGHEYRLEIATALSFDGAGLSLSLDYSDMHSRSDHIRVNHYGFVPDAGMKFAYVGAWLGSLGTLDIDDYMSTFHVVDEQSGDIVYTGTPTLRMRAGDEEGVYDWTNMHSEDVYELDFSAVTDEGQYFLSVPGIGRSYTFRIGPDVYADAFYVAARGLYHQRCGVTIEPPHSRAFRLTACHHKPVQLTTFKLTDSFGGWGTGNAFVQLPAQATGETANWTGGWHDAADYDRRAQHMNVAQRLLDLYELRPQKFTDGQLDIPESDNGIPDIVDEAAWTMDFFLALQDPEDGGVHGGIESESHPDFESAPWNDPLSLYAYAKDEKSSLMFAAVAARLSDIYAALGDTARSSLFIDRAELAWTYALAHDGVSWPDDVAWAAAELYKATGIETYHDAFLQHSVFSGNLDARLAVAGEYDQYAASWVYANTTHPAVDTAIQNGIAAAYRTDAEEYIWSGNAFAYRMLNNPYFPAGGWAATFSAPRGTELLVKTYELTGTKRYYDYALVNNDFYHGGQPLNTIFTTGMGHKSHMRPWYIGTLYDDIDAPYPGITANGPIDCAKAVYPILEDTYAPACDDGFPTLYNWPGAMSFAEIGEFSPQTTQIFMIFASGYFL